MIYGKLSIVSSFHTKKNSVSTCKKSIITSSVTKDIFICPNIPLLNNHGRVYTRLQFGL